MPDDLHSYLGDDTYPLSTDPKDTENCWDIILSQCKERRHFGFGILDSFLDGPDLDRRIGLITKEVQQNEWLLNELKDTLSLNQATSLTIEQINKLQACLSTGKFM